MRNSLSVRLVVCLVGLTCGLSRAEQRDALASLRYVPATNQISVGSGLNGTLTALGVSVEIWMKRVRMSVETLDPKTPETRLGFVPVRLAALYADGRDYEIRGASGELPGAVWLPVATLGDAVDESAPALIFAKPGDYAIRFVVGNVESPAIRVKVALPVDAADAAAWKSLPQDAFAYAMSPVQMTNVPSLASLTEFLRKHPESSYSQKMAKRVLEVWRKCQITRKTTPRWVEECIPVAKTIVDEPLILGPEIWKQTTNRRYIQGPILSAVSSNGSPVKHEGDTKVP